MNNEKYNQIIEEAYENYKHYFENKYGNYITGRVSKEDGEYLIVNKNPLSKETILNIIYSKEEFIKKCKTNPEFSEKWGLKIEERGLTEKERMVLSGYEYENRGGIGWNILKETVDMDNSIPRKLITITYNNETIEIYE